jgi:hypothetical protein
MQAPSSIFSPVRIAPTARNFSVGLVKIAQTGESHLRQKLHMAVIDTSNTKRRGAPVLTSAERRGRARQKTARAERDPPRGIDRELSHQVEILGTQLDDMHAFCRARGYRYATHGIGHLSIEHRSDAVRWCFADALHADAFHATYGGERIRIFGDKVQRLKKAATQP